MYTRIDIILSYDGLFGVLYTGYAMRPLRISDSFCRAVLAACAVYILVSPPCVRAEDVDPFRHEAVILRTVSENREGSGAAVVLRQSFQVKLLTGPEKGASFVAETGAVPTATARGFVPGERVVVERVSRDGQATEYVIADAVRRGPLLWLFILFAFLSVAVAGRRGIASLVSMAGTFVVLFMFILPFIESGYPPVPVTLAGSAVIIPITFFLSHGVNRKTAAAVAGTLVSLAMTGILAAVWVQWARLTGFASEEAGFLEAIKQGSINMKGLLLSGIIIGALGVFDDITISQASVVSEIARADEKLGTAELFTRAMNVGRDHIASMINTLVLVYAGAALPLFVLFVNAPKPFAEVVNYEIVADEIVRTMVGSIGLIISVPITTLLASLMVGRRIKIQ